MSRRDWENGYRVGYADGRVDRKKERSLAKVWVYEQQGRPVYHGRHEVTLDKPFLVEFGVDRAYRVTYAIVEVGEQRLLMNFHSPKDVSPYDKLNVWLTVHEEHL